MVSNELRNRNCTVVNAPGDADVLVVKTAVEQSVQRATTVMGEDTTLLLKVIYRIVARESVNSEPARGQPLLGILVHQLHPLPGLVR